MSDWFDSVTGTNDYERQSWRDSYNGGNAAGDWTGNTNARLSEERDSFQGTTWSGSSSQPSALQLAQSFVGRGSGTVGTPGALSAAGGPGFGTLQTLGRPAPTSGPGRSIVVTAPVQGGFGAPLKTKTKDEVTGLKLGGDWFQSNPWFSNTDQWEERWGEPGDWLGGVVTFGVDVAYNLERMRQAGPAAVGGTIDAGVDAYKKWPVSDDETYFNPMQYQPMSAW